MQINRTQNQPNFGANTIIQRPDIFASYIKRSSTLERFDKQVKASEKIGDSLTITTILFTYNPAKTKPFGYVMQVEQRGGKRFVGVRENLRIPKLAHDAAMTFERLRKAIFAQARQPKVQDEFTLRRNLKRLAMMGNATTIKKER